MENEDIKAEDGIKTEASLESVSLQEDLKKFAMEINNIQAQMEELEKKKQELFRIGVRLEGVISYIKQRLGNISK